MIPEKKKIIDIQKHQLYAYTKELEHGIGLVVFDIDKNISGVKIAMGKTERFSMSRESFESLIIYNKLELVETLPKNIWKDLKKNYNK